MNALALRNADTRARLAALDAVLIRLEDGAPASRTLDADVFEAIGWTVTRQQCPGPGGPQPWTAVPPMGGRAQPLARVSKRIDCAVRLVPWRWSWSVSDQPGRGPIGWCYQREPHFTGLSVEDGPGFLWFECNARTPALALLKAVLYAQRSLMLDVLRAPQWIAVPDPRARHGSNLPMRLGEGVAGAARDGAA